jgi:hypothetical protein
MAKLSVEANAVFSHWHYPVLNFSTSSAEFYAAVEQSLAPHQIPEAEISRVEWKEGGVLSGSREYLRIRRGKLVFDICAAPFGTDFFFSWWLAEIPPRHGLLRLAAILFGFFLAFGLLIWITSSIFGGLLAVFLGWPLAFIAFGVLVWALGKGVQNGTFGADAEDAIIATPFLGWLYVKLFAPSTYHKIDTKLTFQATVHSVVKAIVDQVTTSKGVRTMTELEAKPILRELVNA